MTTNVAPRAWANPSANNTGAAQPRRAAVPWHEFERIRPRERPAHAPACRRRLSSSDDDRTSYRLPAIAASTRAHQERQILPPRCGRDDDREYFETSSVGSMKLFRCGRSHVRRRRRHTSVANAGSPVYLARRRVGRRDAPCLVRSAATQETIGFARGRRAKLPRDGVRPGRSNGTSPRHTTTIPAVLRATRPPARAGPALAKTRAGGRSKPRPERSAPNRRA
jgi:hypothetical protein